MRRRTSAGRWRRWMLPMLLIALLGAAGATAAGSQGSAADRAHGHARALRGHSSRGRQRRVARTHGRVAHDFLATRSQPEPLLARAGTAAVDLAVSSVKPKGAGAAPGRSFAVAVKVKRVRRKPRKAVSALLSAYLSPRATLASKKPATSASGHVKVPASGATKQKLTLVVPIGVAPGQYFVVVCVAPLGRYRDRHAKNNCAAGRKRVTVSRPSTAPVSPEGPQGSSASTGGAQGGKAEGAKTEGEKSSEKQERKEEQKEEEPKGEEPQGEKAPPVTPIPVEATAPAPGPSDAVAPEAAEVATSLSKAEATSFLASIEFLFTGSNPIQVGVAEPSPITEAAAALIHGVVTDTHGQPIGGVRVAILDHEEFGYTDTAADGSFAIAVNGGQTLTLSYSRAGYIPVQNTVQVPVNQSVSAPEVALLGYTGTADDVNLESSAPIQVAEGEVESDPSGTRQATLLFSAGTHATMHLRNGGTQPLSDLHVRATEFTVGEYGPAAMPGTLPPSSAYTYATAFSVDEATEAGATSVSFDKPVVTYVENFLGFPTGAEVPSGNYDADTGQWGASSNGLVVKVLSTSGGVAKLAVDASEEPASSEELKALGITTAELEALATLYSPGQSLWRVPLMHFSSWDFNFLPEHERPQPPPPPSNENPPQDESCHAPGGSTILCDSEAVAEDIPIAGTPFTLHYQSDRVSGYTGSDALAVPITAEGQVPRSVDHIDVEVDILGRTYRHDYCMPGGVACPAGAQQIAAGDESGIEYDVVWDRHDGFGRLVTGSATADVTVTYWVGATYQCTVYTTGGGGSPSYPSEFGATYGGEGGCGAQARELEPVSDTEQVQVGPSANVAGTGLGEWDLSSHDSYDPSSGVLHSGNGADTSVARVAPVLELLAGSESGRQGDGIPATEAALELPEGVLELPDGSVLIAECGANKVREVLPSGSITTFAGTGKEENGGDGGQARGAALACPSSLALAPDGSIYVADEYGDPESTTPEGLSGRIRKIAPNGIISTVAGGGAEEPREAVGKQATKAALYFPGQIALGPDGSLYIADRDEGLIERVDTSGVLSLVGYDARTETTPELGEADGIAVNSAGEVLVSDDEEDKVVRIGAGGTTVVAGTGAFGHGGDGEPATQAELEEPGTIAIGPDGNIFLAEDSFPGRVRMINASGIISTIAGGGADLPSEGDIPATAAELFSVDGLFPNSKGELLISQFIGSVYRMKTSLAGVSNGNLLVPTEQGSRIDEFNAGGRELAVYDASTSVKLLSFGYDSAGRLTEVVDQYGRTTRIERNGSGQPTAIVAPDGQTTGLTVNGGGALETITDPDGHTWRAGYDAAGQLDAFTDPNGKSSSMEYDSLGRLRSDTDASGAKTTLSSSFTTSEEGTAEKVVTVHGPDGLTTTYGDAQDGYGDSSRKITEPDGAVTTFNSYLDGFSYVVLPNGTEEFAESVGDPRFGLAAPIVRNLDVQTPNGSDDLSATETRTVQLAEPNDPLSVTKLTNTLSIDGGTPATSTYEASDRTLTATSPEGRVSTATYDNHDDLVSETEPASTLATQYAWDLAHGRLTEATQGSHSQTLAYDPAGDLQSVTDAAGNSYSYARDADGLVTELTDQLGFEYGFGHDENGEVTSLKTPSGAESKLGYTAVGQIGSYRAPTQSSGTSFEYDLARQPKKLTRPEGSLEYSYDSGGRLTSTTSASAGSDTFSYPAHSNLPERLEHEDPGGATQTLKPTYDGEALVEMALAEEDNGATAAEETYSYSYYEGRLTELALQAGPAGSSDTELSYDEDGLLTGFGPFTITREAASGLPSQIGGGNFTETLAHNAFGEESERRIEVDGKPIYGEAIARDEDTGRVSSRAETIAGKTSTYEYVHDKDGRLTGVSLNGSSSEKYAYDEDGNLSARQSGAEGEQQLAYDAQGRETKLGGTKYEYNEDGQLSKRGADTFSYGIRPGELESATVGATTVTYDYDAAGQRVARIEGTGEPERYLYGDPQLPNLLTASIAPDGTLTTYYYDGAGRLIGFERGEQRYYVATDANGSPRVITNSEGGVEREIAYDAYGAILHDSNPSFSLPIGYDGGLTDPLTGLVHFGQRDYEPASGRFTERDPTLLAGGLNLYAFVGDDPIDNIDPNGTSAAREEFDKAREEAAAASQPDSNPPPPAPWYSRANDWLNNHVFYPLVDKATGAAQTCKELFDPETGPKGGWKAVKALVEKYGGNIWGGDNPAAPATPILEQELDQAEQTMSQAGTHSMANGGPGMDTSGNIYGGGP